MPRFDGAGPWWGCGPRSGRGLGPCGMFSRGRGFGWRLTGKEEKEMLKQEAQMLEEELKEIKKQISETKD